MSEQGNAASGEEQGASAEGAAPVPAVGDAMPCITASQSCRPIERILRYGVDSLYVSFLGQLNEDVERKLIALKEKAQSEHPGERAEAQWESGSRCFEVKDKGRRHYALALEDGNFRIELARRSASAVPMAYVRLNSGYLCSVTPVQAVEELRKVLSEFGAIDVDPKVSRIDLFVDFASHMVMEWSRSAWVTRAKRKNEYGEGERLMGWGIGYGGPLTARLYDKNHEIELSNKQYVRTLWDQMGWNNSDPVWRLEFQFGVEVLHRFGLSRFSAAIEQLNGLWSYATDEWLRLALPSTEDATRSRWPVHPLWAELSAVDFGGPEMPRLRSVITHRAPKESKVLRRIFSNIATMMTLRGQDTFASAWDEIGFDVQKQIDSDGFFEGATFDKLLNERIALRRREYNLGMNEPSARSPREDQGSRNYRNASRG